VIDAPPGATTGDVPTMSGNPTRDSFTVALPAESCSPVTVAEICDPRSPRFGVIDVTGGPEPIESAGGGFRRRRRRW
jgi:hypothetical protein